MTKPLTVSISEACARISTALQPTWRQVAAIPAAGWAAVGLSAGLAPLFWRYAEPYGAGRAARVVLIAGVPFVTLSSLLWPPPSQVVWSLYLGWSLLVLAVVDSVAFLLPDALTLSLAAVGIVRALLERENVTGSLAGAAAGFASLWLLGVGYRRLRGREGMGLGDAKLLGAAGAWLGISALPAVLLLACAAGLGLILLSASRTGRGALQARLPFGGPLCAAIWLAWLAR